GIAFVRVVGARRHRLSPGRAGRKGLNARPAHLERRGAACPVPASRCSFLFSRFARMLECNYRNRGEAAGTGADRLPRPRTELCESRHVVSCPCGSLSAAASSGSVAMPGMALAAQPQFPRLYSPGESSHKEDSAMNRGDLLNAADRAFLLQLQRQALHYFLD